ncbi:MAG: ADP-forming succinate--CoA ligase subunit beta [Myxococcales bacterium]|nr:ADP-forming succinate--CoA ligase subunit beta [Myxococcales bacterium]
MNLHEYQAKELMLAYGVPVPPFRLVTNPWEAYEAAQEIGGDQFVVKAQIHAGGRGKAGGVKLAHNLDEVHELAGQIYGKILVTPQTGPAGKQVKKLIVSKAVEIAREFYLAILVDRSRKTVAVMASREGGVEIEQVAAQTPEKIILRQVDVLCGLPGHLPRGIAYALGLSGPQIRAFSDLVAKLYRLFVEKDASLLEINPLVVDNEGALWAADAKLSIDDNALGRHPELRRLRDYDEEDPLEIQARRYGVDYVKLDGNIGCLVNGAGLAMATMDQIKLAGGFPANFLDIKGGAGKQNVINAFKLLTADTRVRAVLINIFGGIVRVDMVAAGILSALNEIEVKLPIVIRVEGTNAEEGRKLLLESSHSFIVADGLADAARKVVAAAGGVA